VGNIKIVVLILDLGLFKYEKNDLPTIVIMENEKKFTRKAKSSNIMVGFSYIYI